MLLYTSHYTSDAPNVGVISQVSKGLFEPFPQPSAVRAVIIFVLTVVMIGSSATTTVLGPLPSYSDRGFQS